MTHHVNGNGHAEPKPARFMRDDFDPDDPEYIKEMQRPADVSEDLQEMKRRERVTMVLKSQAFRDELESVIHDAMKDGGNPTSLLALQQISELILPQNRFNQTGLLNAPNSGPGPRGASIVPIADIRGVDALNYTKGEKLLRCKLAALYRLVDLQGWTQGIYNHITVRISQEHDHFLINPFGMLYNEISASSLVKVDLSGQIVDSGSTSLGINLAGYLLHSAIHGARPDVRCVIHFHTGPCAAVSSMKAGLLPISQEAAVLGEISYHDYEGILVDDSERDRIIRSLGPYNKVMVLRNHGVVACGATIEEAFHYAFNLHAACEVQVRAMSAGLDNLILMDKEVQRKVWAVVNKPGGVDSGGEGKKKWRLGEMEFEGWMRMLDNMGYRTGYIYRNPLLRNDQQGRLRTNQDVEIPPAVSSLANGLDEDGIGSLLKEYLERKKGLEKVRWLNTPNAYQKVELLETGTSDPKKVTKWVQDGTSPSPGGTPIKVSSLQFSPAGTDVREFRQKQQQMKDKRNQGIISSGPESRVLEGVSWDDANQMPDAQLSGSGERLITVGAVSKGIIKRDQQHNVGAYQATYQRNPFDSNTPEEVEQYLLEVERKKQPGGHPADVYEVRMEERRPQQPINTATHVRAHTPPPIPSAKEHVSQNSFTRSKSDRFSKGRSGTFPRSAAAPLGVRNGDETGDTGSEGPNSPASEKGLKKSDTLDSGDLDGSKSELKKKKKGFRIPSFSMGRKKSRDGDSQV
ncbi:Protein hu-li tai shao [Hypsibius exemplaris]|uniref:Protein hu-li tai shao n=1 Tax=Hypsibius exemplaris TaxID=2072580 RepID=A0A1W0XET6_HYPEX|nr:Protein hu-li tai shao [Hypsibius exemplaris]